jgi:hypothetical protein
VDDEFDRFSSWASEQQRKVAADKAANAVIYN